MIFANIKIKNYVFPVIIIFVGFILSILKINGSSIGIWNKYFYGDSIDKSLLLFEPRGIRSDEWLVQSPFVLSHSNLIGSSTISQGFESKNIVMLPVPAVSFKTLFHPNVWGYFFLPIEQAFSFNWWFNDLILLIFSYLFLKVITKKTFFSIFFSFIILFSSFTQWWRGGAIAVPAFGFAILYFIVKIFHYRNTNDLVKNVFFLNYFLLCYFFILYPPFQLSFGFFMLLFVIGYVLNHKNDLNKKRFLILSLVSCFVIIVSAICIYLYFNEFKDVISIIQNTVYPGKRIAYGGGYSWIKLLNGFYNIQLLVDAKGSGPWVNQSEASNFLLLYPYIAPIYIFIFVNQLIKKKVNWIFCFNILYLIIATLWLFIPFPTWFSKITFLYLVPINRMLIGIGLADLFLNFYFLFKINIPRTKLYFFITLVQSFITFVVNYYIGNYLLKNYPTFIHSEMKIFIISFIAGTLVFLLLNKKYILFIFIFLGYLVISTYSINPFYVGIDPVINTALANKIQKIEKNNMGKYKWIVYDTGMLGQYLIANGANSLSGVYTYPQFDLMHVFDSQENYINIWNRYANVFFVNEKNNTNGFELIGVDQFKINIDPCNEKFKKLNVKYYIFTTNVRYICLRDIDKFSTYTDGYINYLYLYERIDY